MSKPTNLFRRGAVYWWRRRLTLSVFGNYPISLSLSLLTKELSIARARGAAMTMASEGFRMTIQQRLRVGLISPEQANRIANEEAKAFRMTLVMVDANLVGGPELPVISPDRSRVCLEQFWSGSERAGVPEAPDEEYALKNWLDLTADEQQHLMALVQRVQPAVGLTIDAFERLGRVGAEPSDVNLSLARRLIVRARAEVARQDVQGDLLGEWLDEVEVNLPPRQLPTSMASFPALQSSAAVAPPTFLPANDLFGSVGDAVRRILHVPG